MASFTSISSSISTFFLLLVFLFVLPSSQAQNSPQEYINAHNSARSQVGVGPMTWNTTLATYAQNYANSRKYDCRMVHSGGPYGENISKGSGYLTGAGAVSLWVAEKKYYDYYSNSCIGGECRHYTQVVWRKSVRLGCGRVQCVDGWWYVVCSYDPPGNYVNQRPY